MGAMNTYHNGVDGLLPWRSSRVEGEDEPTNISKTVVDLWGLALVIGVAVAAIWLMFPIEIAQTRPLVLDDAVYLLVPLGGLFALGPVVFSGWRRKTVFATDAGLLFEHRGQWWEVAWSNVGDLQRVGWDYRPRNALYFVDILDGSEPSRVYFVPTRDADSFLEYYRAEFGSDAKQARCR
jgi:hypothetical protein